MRAIQKWNGAVGVVWTIQAALDVSIFSPSAKISLPAVLLLFSWISKIFVAGKEGSGPKETLEG